jgi:CheY-like chemotaxis protein/CheY-specific phosphatase CheX
MIVALPLTGKTILVVDDDKDILEIYQEELGSAGADVVIANDGLAALEMITKNRFDVIVTDLHMPRIDGLQLVSFVKSQDLNAKTLVVMISGMIPPTTMERLVMLGVIDILMKPLLPEQLTQHIVKRMVVPVTREVAYSEQATEFVRNSCKETLQAYIPEIAEIDTYVKSDDLPNGTAYAVLPFFGKEVFGTIAIGMDDVFIAELAKHLFGVEGAKDLKREILVDIVGEMINQIGGALKRFFETAGAPVKIGLPLTFNMPTRIPKLVPGQTFCVRFGFGSARCTLEAAMGSVNKDSRTELFALYKPSN